MSIGGRIKESRKSLNLTQTEFADSIGVSSAYMSQIENNSRKPSYDILLNISSRLNVSVEFLLSGVSMSREPGSIDAFLSHCTSFLDEKSRSNLIDYVFSLGRTNRYLETPPFVSASDYAQWILRKLKISEMPICIRSILKELDVDIYYSDISEEGILYKSKDNPVIILDFSFKDIVSRETFTLALLLGHLILPWHSQPKYSRLKKKKSLDHDKPWEIEARQFAAEILLPTNIIKKDMAKFKLTISNLESAAYDKYKCSMGALVHKLSEIIGDKFVYITSEGGTFSRKYDSNFKYKVVDQLQPESNAHSFISKPASRKEIREGLVPAEIWLQNAPKGTMIYEESMLDPKQGVTVTLLQLHKD